MRPVTFECTVSSVERRDDGAPTYRVHAALKGAGSGSYVQATCGVQFNAPAPVPVDAVLLVTIAPAEPLPF